MAAKREQAGRMTQINGRLGALKSLNTWCWFVGSCLATGVGLTWEVGRGTLRFLGFDWFNVLVRFVERYFREAKGDLLRDTIRLAPLRYLAGLLMMAGSAFAQEARERPNIVLVLVDDLGKEWVGCYGADGIETPHLDAMAAGGMRFHHVYSMPQCTPSRVTLLTGQYPYRTGWINHWDVPRWGAGCHFDPTHFPALLARDLRNAGYATAIAGKWQIDDFRVEPDALDEAGFDQWCMWTGGEGKNPPSDERYWDPYVFRNNQPSQTLAGQFGPDVYHQFVLDFISQHQQRPFFVYYAMTLTHSPFVPTPDEPNATGKMDRHKAMVRYMDKLVGKMNSHLEQLGLHRDTIVLWTTDNGTAQGITGAIDGRPVPGGKSLTTENGINAPLIAYCPGRIPAGRDSQSLVDFTDFLPTCIELTGAAPPAKDLVDGISFAGVLLGHDERSPRRWIMAMGGQNNAQVTEAGVENEWYFRDRVFRNERYKAFVNTDRQIERLTIAEFDFASDQNLINAPPEDALSFLSDVKRALEGMPDQDRDPRYTPLPPQPWDRPITARSQIWKKGRPQPSRN